MARIKFLMRWRMYAEGAEADLGFPIGEILVNRKIAEWVPAPSPDPAVANPEPECMAVEAPERAVVARPRTRRTRRTKASE